eukprot:scaffold109781_cov92-Cyclotella_meneghiniana.AAC.4
MTTVPLASDDYDRPHTTTALLASLHCTTSSFDAVMDSLLSTTSLQAERVRSLEKRVERARALIAKLERMHDKKGISNLCRMESPTDYKDALRGIENGIRSLQSSAVGAARAAAGAAIRAALRQDATADDGQAIPSDAWLDQASMGIGGLAHSLEVAEAQRRVPLLYGSLVGDHRTEGSGRCMADMEYQGILDSISKSDSRSNIPGRLTDLANSQHDEQGDDDDSIHSATSRISALSMSSNISASGRMTAIQRRRWHEQQQQLRNIKAGGAVVHEGEETEGTSTTRSTKPTTASNFSSSIVGRQQALSGSHPYLCEVLHDSYGIGSEFPEGLVECSGFSSHKTREGGTEFFSPPSSIADLVVFNTSRDSYGLANRRAAAIIASAVPASEKETTTQEKTEV